MPAVQFPRAVSSSATTISISEGLPSWAPGLGQYADISLLTAQATAGVNPCPAGNCPYTANEGQSAIWRDWNGGAFASGIGAMGSMLFHGGGHWGYFGNEVLRYDIATRAWSRLNNPSNYGFNKDGWAPYTLAPTNVVNSYGGFPDGAPNPLHTYNNFEYVPPDGAGNAQGSLIFMHRANSNSQVSDPRFWKFDIAALSWSNGPTAIKTDLGQGTALVALCYDSKRKGIWKMDRREYQDSQGLSFYSLLTGLQYDVPMNAGNSFAYGRPGSSMLSYNAARDCLVFFRYVGEVSQLACADLSSFTLGVTAFVPTHQITQSGTPHPNLMGGTAYVPYLEWCPYDGNYYIINWPNDARLYKLTVPAVLTGTWAWSSELLTPKSGTGAVAFEARSADNNLFSRFRYAPALKAFVWSDGNDLPVQAGRPSNFA